MAVALSSTLSPSGSMTPRSGAGAMTPRTAASQRTTWKSWHLLLVILIAIASTCRISLPVMMSMDFNSYNDMTRTTTTKRLWSSSSSTTRTPVESFPDRLARLSSLPKKESIFFKHIRKAAGTGMRAFVFRKVLQAKKRSDCTIKKKACEHHNITYYEQEYGSLSVACSSFQNNGTTTTIASTSTPSVSMDKTLTMTVFRDPLDRIWSEFWYKNGPPGKAVDRLLNETNYLLLQGAFLQWVLREGEPTVLRTAHPQDEPRLAREALVWTQRIQGMHPFAYNSNFLTRLFLGQCDEKTPFDKDPNVTGIPLNLRPKLWCTAGPELFGGCFFRDTPRYPSRDELEYAKAMLSSFDIVLTTKTMQSSMKAVTTIIQNTLKGYANITILPQAANRQESLNQTEQQEQAKQKNVNSNGYPRMTDVLSEEVMEFLRQDNAADMEFYAHAQQLAATFLD